MRRNGDIGGPGETRGVLEVAYNPYLDAVLREHLLRAAAKFEIPIHDLEDLLENEADAVAWLKEASPDAFEAYVDDADAAVNHVGWVLTPLPAPRRGEQPT